MRLGPSAPRADAPWQKPQFAAYTGAPRLAASASGSGPSPRNSRTACPDRIVAGVPDGVCANSAVGRHANNTTANISRMVLLRGPAAVDEDIRAGDEARGFRAQVAGE